jgi:tartrate-resistant acid phosphatase type 5
MARRQWLLLFSMLACTRPRSPDAGVTAPSTPTPAAFADDDAGAAVRFVAMGDTGKGNPGQYKVGAAVAAHCVAKGCDFVVLLGDNFYPSGVDSTSDPKWQTAFVEPYAAVQAPFYAVLGNHDCGGNGAGTELPKGDNEVAYSAVNPKWKMPARHYRFHVTDVDFFVADTNRSMFSLDHDVRQDFEAWLTSSTARWKIAFGHHPYVSNGPHGNAGAYDGHPFIPIANGSGVKRFLEDDVCGRADLYLSAHDHNLQWPKATCTREGSTRQTQLIVSGGGALTTPLMGSQPAWYQSDSLGFVSVKIQGDVLTATFYDDTGAERYSRTVTRQP